MRRGIDLGLLQRRGGWFARSLSLLLSVSAAAVGSLSLLALLLLQCGPLWAVLFAPCRHSPPTLPQAPVTRLFVKQTLPEGLW